MDTLIILAAAYCCLGTFIVFLNLMDWLCPDYLSPPKDLGLVIETAIIWPLLLWTPRGRRQFVDAIS